MNIGKSIKIALAMKGENQEWLANKTNVTRSAVTQIANSTHCSTFKAKEIASVFSMKTSEFIALGED
jgi:DNA-binding XRE family transcriptional regulator